MVFFEKFNLFHFTRKKITNKHIKFILANLEEMILDNRFHTRLAFLQSGLLYFLCKESEEERDIDLVNLQYYLAERYPNKEFLREKECSEFSPRERMSIFIDFMNEAL